LVVRGGRGKKKEIRSEPEGAAQKVQRGEIHWEWGHKWDFCTKDRKAEEIFTKRDGEGVE